MITFHCLAPLAMRAKQKPPVSPTHDEGKGGYFYNSSVVVSSAAPSASSGSILS